MLLRSSALLLLCLVSAALTFAAAPLPAKVWDADIRYRIFAFNEQRIRQYRELVADLKAAGFTRDPGDPDPDSDPDNPNANQFVGTLLDRGVKRVVAQRHVRIVFLIPRGATVPPKGSSIRIDVFITPGFSPDTQRNLHRRTAVALSKEGKFAESVLYDNKGYTRLVGSVPVENLGKLLADDPKPARDDDVRPPSRGLTAIRLIVARPDLPVPSAMPKTPEIPKEQQKFDPALRAILADAVAGKPGRLEVILGNKPCRDKAWLKFFEIDGVVVEGRTGPLVTVYGVVKDIAPKLGALEEIVAVRLPRAARQAPAGHRGEVPAKWEPVKASGLTQLHAIGERGKGTRIAIIADDFTGWEKLKGRRDEKGKYKLADPVLLDLTAARNPNILPDPYPSGGKGAEPGHGTRCAQTILKAAPEAQLTLIRVDAAASYMLEEAARAINGEPLTRSLSLDLRFRELQSARRDLEVRGEELLEERKLVFDDVREDDTAKKRREAYLKKQKEFDAEMDVFRSRESRFLDLIDAMKKLKGIRIVASGLVWLDGYPVDGSSALSRYFDDAPFKAALWFQAAGDTRGQAWASLFRDANANGFMEFAEGKTPLPPGSWSNEINFLSWRPADAAPQRLLPEGTPLRITLQWREPHDCLPLKAGEDVYRQPLAKLRVVLVHQPDPSGNTRPADDIEVIAEAGGLPQRLNQTMNSSTWEQVIQVRLPKAGRYGVFIEGKVPESTQAEGEARLPGTKRFGELRPRLFVNTLDDTGRAVWADYATDMAALGMPADAKRVITVGAADAKNRARPDSATGPPLNMALMQKPNVLAYDEGGGTAEAACFAAGLAASSWGCRGSLVGLVEEFSRRPGDVLRVPQRRK